MAFMLMQRITTAVLDGYGDAPDVEAEREASHRHRVWLESLEIDPNVRGALVEQACAVEDAFERLARRRTR